MIMQYNQLEVGFANFDEPKKTSRIKIPEGIYATTMKTHYAYCVLDTE